jgi:hypothetical protein
LQNNNQLERGNFLQNNNQLANLKKKKEKEKKKKIALTNFVMVHWHGG